MSDCTRWSFQRKIEWFRRQFAQHASLPFSEVLPAQVVTTALNTLCVRFYDSLYNPVTVLWLFLSQVIDANPTLGVTVENFLAWRLGQGMSACSTETGAYAQARQRLPEKLLAVLTRHTGAAADRAALAPWRWLGRTVKLFDGLDARHAEEPGGLSAEPQASTRRGLSDSTHRGCCFRCRWALCWTWEFAAGRASFRANWPYSAT